MTLTTYDAGADGDFGTDDDPEPSVVDMTDAFPQIAGLGLTTDFLPDMAYVPASDQLIGFADLDEGSALVTFAGDGSWVGALASCDLPSGDCLDAGSDRGIHYDATDELLYVRLFFSLVAIPLDGSTLQDIWVDRFDGPDTECCLDGLTRHPATGDFFAVRNTESSAGAVARFSIGADETWNTDDDALFQVGYTDLLEAQDIVWDGLNERFLVVSEGAGAVRSFGLDWMPGTSYWLGYSTELTELKSIEAHPTSGEVYLYDDAYERLYTTKLPE